VPPRRPKRRPHLRTSAIQRPSGGRCLLLLVFQAWPAASHLQSPSSGAEQTSLPTPSGIPLTRAAGADALVACGSSYESPVTEATGPARLFRGPRNKNRTRYGTMPLGCHDQEAACRRRLERAGRPLRAPRTRLLTSCLPTENPQRRSTSRGGSARINRFTPSNRGPIVGRRTRCTRMNQARRPGTEQRKVFSFQQKLTPRNEVLGKPNSPP
jgi:hypothetical protein